MIKLIRLAVAIGLSALLLGCNSQTQEPVKPPNSNQDWPAITAALNCLAPSGPIIAAHRGRDKSKGLAENSLSALNQLRRSGYIMAEIDIAQLRDKTLIAFHDGIWDDISTAKGPIASSDWDKAKTVLLKTRRGKLTSDRPARLSDILSWANRQFYLEIDFKSSADERAVIKEIHTSGMANHVILIAYNKAQEKRLTQISKSVTGQSMTISVTAHKSLIKNNKNIIAWLGNDRFNANLAETLSRQNIPVAYGLFSPKYAKKAPYWKANILVTDYPDEAKTLANVKARDDERLKACQ